MNVSQPPAAPSGQPTVVQQTTVIHVGSHKSVGGAVALAFFLGPLGMLYATVPGALVMFVVNILMVIGTAGIGLLLTVPIGMVWAGVAASSHNKGLGIATQAIAQPAAHSPAGWHPDPDGGNRMRYWDGQRWTQHYSENSDGADSDEPAQLEAAVSEGSTVACESCGEQFAAGQKFCASCGTARPTST